MATPAIALTAAVLLACSASAQSSPALQPGDTAVVVPDSAPLLADGRPVATLARGTRLHVLRVDGDRAEGVAESAGRPHGGVAVADLERQPPAAAERPSDAAALRALGATIERDRHGRAVAVAGPQFNNDDLIHLKGLPFLEVVDLDGSAVDDRGVPHLEQHPAVTRVYAGHTGISDAGLESLAGIDGLEVLDLTATRVTGRNAARLGAAEHLLVLNLSHNRLVDDALLEISAARRLETLALVDTGLGGRALAPLMRLKRLNVLTLDGCPVGDDGLVHLYSLSSLRIVYARDAGITPGGEKNFSKWCRQAKLLYEPYRPYRPAADAGGDR